MRYETIVVDGERITLATGAARATRDADLYEQLVQMERRDGQRQELPPLPPVDGYGVRHEGHYSAQQMRDYAWAALAAERSS